MSALKEEYIKIKKVLENDNIQKEIKDIEEYGIDKIYDYIIKIINFLVSTKNYHDLIKYMDLYQELFPKRYLRTKGLSYKEIEKVIYENFILNGYLYHITDTTNVNNILTNGLLTLTDRFGINVYHDYEKINTIFKYIYERNKNITISNIVNIPGTNCIDRERFNKVYLSSNLKYIIDIYGNQEMITLLIRDLLWALNLFEVNIDYLTKEEIIKIIINELNNLDVKDNEKNFIIYFLNKYIDYNKLSNDKTIIMVPTKFINSNDSLYRLYSRRINELSVEELLEISYGEISNNGSIKPDNIMTLSLNKDRSLELKLGKSLTNKKNISIMNTKWRVRNHGF